MTDLSFTTAKPALKSLTLQSLVALAVATALQRVGASLPFGVAQDIAGAAVDFLSMIGLVGAAVGRARAKGPLG